MGLTCAAAGSSDTERVHTFSNAPERGVGVDLIGGVMLSLALRTAIGTDLDFWEGSFAYMYLDSVGLVTIGYGTMLPNAEAAKRIPFLNGSGGAATPEEIEAAFNKVQSGSATQKSAVGSKKFGAKHYLSITDLRISPETASALREVHVDADYLQLKAVYPQFDTFPDPAKIALFDMIYNLGAGRPKTRHHKASGLRGFLGMNAAIAAGDWNKAAQLSHRHGIPDKRNLATANRFKECIPLAAAAAPR